MTALDWRTTPEFEGRVRVVSADAVLDEATGASDHSVEIVLTEAAFGAIGADAMGPGTPSEAFIKTDFRRPIYDLTRALTGCIARAVRE